jgi:hypothetical protein
MSQLPQYQPGDLPCGARLATAIAPVESHETTKRLAELLAAAHDAYYYGEEPAELWEEQMREGWE